MDAQTQEILKAPVAGPNGHLSLGLQRVLGVRVLLTVDGPVGEAVGILRRRPVVQRISLATAAALVAAGAPLAVRAPDAGDGPRPAGADPAAAGRR